MPPEPRTSPDSILDADNVQTTTETPAISTAALAGTNNSAIECLAGNIHYSEPQMNSPRSSDEAAKTSSEGTLSPAQFATEFQGCYSRLWLLAAAILGDRHLAEDIVQDAGIAALRQLHEFKAGTNFLAWMSQIVRFQAFNRSRKRTRRRTQNVDPVTLDSEIERDTGNQPADQLPDASGTLPPEQTFFDDETMRALQDLRDVARACLLLRVVHQLSYGDIAEMLDIAEGTAMSHVHRSKSLLRKRLSAKPNQPDNLKK